MYAICILIGIFLGIWATKKRIDKVADSHFQETLLLITIPVAIISARIYHVLSYFGDYFNSSTAWYEFIMINHGGLAIFGGLIGGVTAAFIICRKHKVSFLKVIDAYTPGILIGQICGRVGNYFNQELYGMPTGSNDYGLQVTGHQVLYHPTFLYEMLWNLLGLILIIAVSSHDSILGPGRSAWSFQGVLGFLGDKGENRNSPRPLSAKGVRGAGEKPPVIPGQIFAIYLCWYSFGRIFIESIRINYSTIVLGLRFNIWTAIFSLIFAIFLLFFLKYLSKKPKI
jgi:prolipoprotein diacylglyceryltransferase